MANPWRRRVVGLRPSTEPWARISDVFKRFTDHFVTEELLVLLARGKVDKCPFPPSEIESLKDELIGTAAVFSFQMNRKTGDRMDTPIDYRFLHMLLQMARDPEVGLGKYAQGVRVGPGTRMPRLPALYRPKRKWRLASQQDPLDYLEQTADPGCVWRRNYLTLADYEGQVLEVMHDQASRGQLLVFSEAEARRTYPNLVIASLGAQRKEKPGGRSRLALREFQDKAQRPGTGADRC